MSAFSTDGDVFSDPEISTPDNSLSARMSDMQIHMAATSLTTQRWASDLVIDPLTSLCSCISVPGPDSIMRSEHAQQRRMERRSLSVCLSVDDIAARLKCLSLSVSCLGARARPGGHRPQALLDQQR